MIRTVVADPPWQFGDRLPGPGRGAARHYATMSVDQLAAWRSTWDFELAPDAYLLLWRVASMQREALAVADAWGFVVKTELVWRKLTRTSGRLWFGMGRTLRAAHETCLVATRGRPQPMGRSTRTVFDAPVGAHSEKPDEFFRIVERTFPPDRVELFARRRRDGWIQYGDQLADAVA